MILWDYTGRLSELAVLYFDSESNGTGENEKVLLSIFPKATIIHEIKNLISNIFEKNLESFFDLYVFTGEPEAILNVLDMFPETNEKTTPVPKLYLSNTDNEKQLARLLEHGITHIYSASVSGVFSKYMFENIGREAIFRKERDSFRLSSEKLKKKIANISEIYHKEAQRMEDKIKSKDTWFASMVHELRTPVNGIMGITHLLSNTNLDNKQRDYLQKIEGSSKILLELVNDLLDFSKIEAGELVIEQISFDINSVLENVSSIIGAKAEEKYLSLIFDISKDVPKNIKGDPLRLSQVLINLLNNAIKFTEEGEVILKISMQSRDKKSGVLLFEIIDSGIGMNAEQIEKLFQAFTQADPTTSRKYGGTGLGLSISKHLVELMGGEIRVESKENRGSVFSFTMPTEQLERRSYRLPSKELMNKKVLIADSNAKSAEALNRMLSYFHFSTSIAGSIQEANVFIETGEYDMVFIDEMVLKDIEPGNSGAKIVMMKKGLTADDEKMSYRLKIDNYLNKPFTQQMIFNVILDLYADGSSKLSHSTYEEQKSLLKQSSGKKILLAEDNTVNQAVILGLLENTNIEVVVAPDGVEALEYLKRNSGVSLILMDINMPKMNGYETSRKIRKLKKYQNTPIVAMTADYVPPENLRNSGIQEYMSKPLEVNNFYKVLTKYLNIDGSGKDRSKKREEKPVDDLKDKSIANAPAADTAVENESPFAVAGLNIAKGLERAGGNEDLYLTLVRNFLDMYAHAPEEIKKLLLKGEYEEGAIISSSMADSAANISAERIYRISKQLSSSIKDWKNEESLKICDRLGYAIRDIKEGMEHFHKDFDLHDAKKEKKAENKGLTLSIEKSPDTSKISDMDDRPKTVKSKHRVFEKSGLGVKGAEIVSPKPENQGAGSIAGDTYEWKSAIEEMKMAVKSNRSFLCSSLIKNLRKIQPLESSGRLADRLSELLKDRNFKEMLKILEESDTKQ